MLKIVECRPGRSQQITPINLDDLPATIGRSREATYQMAVGVDPRSIYFRSLSRVHATLYRKDGDIWLRDGNGTPSENGCYHDGRKIYNPIRFYPGLTVEIFTAVEGYHLYVTYESTGGEGEEFSTLGLEQEFLSQELRTADERIGQLTWTVSELEKRLDTNNKEDDALKQSIREIQQKMESYKTEKVLLARQLRQLKRLLIGIAVVAIAAAWLLLGGNADSLELLGKAVISIVSLVGLIAGIKD